jgi:hypothetical protein
MVTAEKNRAGGIGACRIALAIAIVWAPAVLILGVATGYTATYGHKLVEVVGSVYYGYGPGWGPALVGMAWGFVDAFIGVLIIAWIYNLLGRRGKGCRSTGASAESQAAP